MNNGKRKKNAPLEVEESSGNVFADLDLANPEELLARSKVIGQIHDIILRDKLTDEAAASILEISAIDVDTILRGDVDDQYAKMHLQVLLRKLQKATSGSKRKAKKPSSAIG